MHLYLPSDVSVMASDRRALPIRSLWSNNGPAKYMVYSVLSVFMSLIRGNTDCNSRNLSA